MINETILAIIIAFAISAMLCPVVIPFLHKLKFGQQVRDDPDHGRSGDFNQYCDYFSVLYQRLSEADGYK